MLIEWIGHACFFMTTKNGTKIITDVYDDSIGLTVPKKHADIVLVSHDHFDHRNAEYLDALPSQSTVIDKVGSFEVDGVNITGLPVYHDDEQGALRGSVICYLIETDGMRILHMGDVGDMPSDDFFEKAGRVDILMIPIGGYYTVDAKGALNIIDRLHPNITIPMHYLVRTLNMKELATNHDFLVRAASREYDISHIGHTLEISADNLKKRSRIVVMECASC